jgi:hypothetical protein
MKEEEEDLYNRKKKTLKKFERRKFLDGKVNS